jgi:hypothetical protein
MEFAPFGQDGIPLTREKQQNIKGYVMNKKLFANRVSKPSIILTSHLLIFPASLFLSSVFSLPHQ